MNESTQDGERGDRFDPGGKPPIPAGGLNTGANRWRGFNLPNLTFPPGDFRFPDMVIQGYGRFFENEFQWIAEWGFNWVRLPVSYDWYVRMGNPLLIDHEQFRVIDEAVMWGQRYGLHVNLGLVHAPGYVNGADYWIMNEPFDLWKDEAALDCFTDHWKTFARRYRGVPPEDLSFCLIAEPARTDVKTYGRVMRAAAAAIAEVDPSRPLVIEGLHFGTIPLPELADLGSVHCCRGYAPLHISHRQAWWVDGVLPDDLPQAWPVPLPADRTGHWLDSQPLNEEELRSGYYAGWIEMQQKGKSIHCGEMGFWNRTKHSVGLAWMENLLSLFREWQFGWALWNFTGSFGILDSGRTDVNYKSFHGHLLDEEYLKLLQKY